MNINIRSAKIALNETTKDYIREKMNKLERYLGRIKAINCDVDINQEAGGQKSGDIYRAVVNLELPGKLLRVEKTEKDLLKAIDKIKDHLARGIDKYKEKYRG